MVVETDKRKVKERVRRLLKDKPKYEKPLRQILEYEEHNAPRHPPTAFNVRNDTSYDIRWSWDEVGVDGITCYHLFRNGLLQIVFKSNKNTDYVMVNREAVREYFEEEEERRKISEVRPPREEDFPEDLFGTIAGHDDMKWILNKSIKGSKHHVLMVGPPATAKTIFLLELGRLPGSEYMLGHSTTAPGLEEQVMDKPGMRYMLIDEIDKMSKEDHACLLSLMETGIVKTTKSGKQEETERNINVYAACNREKNLPPELLDRFEIFPFREYTREEFIDICESTLTERENISPDLALQIAVKVAGLKKDIRMAIRIGRVCSSKEEVEKYLEIMKKRKKE